MILFFEACIRVFVHIYLSEYMQCTYMRLSKGVSLIYVMFQRTGIHLVHVER